MSSPPFLSSPRWGGSPFLPVLFVHGIQPHLFSECGRGGGTGTWGQAIGLLKGEGVDVWEFQYVSRDFVDDSAQLLSQAVDTILAQAAVSRVRVIAHSLGGLVTRAYIQDHGGSAHVDKLLAFGTPHWGIGTLCVAAVATRGCSNAAELEFNSVFLNHLNTFFLPDLPSPGPDYIFVAGDVGKVLCTLENKPADQLVEVFSAQGLGLVSNNNRATITLQGYSHPFLELLHPGLVNVTGSAHPGYQEMLAFATEQAQEQSLTLHVTATPDPVRPGDLLTYTYTVTNEGPVTLPRVTLDDIFPNYVTVQTINDGGGCRFSCVEGNIVRWFLDDLAAGQSRTVFMSVRVNLTANVPPNGTFLSSQTRVLYSGAGAVVFDDTDIRVCAGGGTTCDILPQFTVSGRITTPHGAGLAGVTMTFTRISGAGQIPAAVLTSANGNWNQSGFSVGSTYRVTPSKSGYFFTPSSRTFSGATVNLNFASTFSTSYHGVQRFADNLSHPLNLGGGNTSLAFSVPQQRRVVILFNAECSVKADDDTTWVDIDVLVDGVAAPPSNDDNAFCTSTGNGQLNRLVSASTYVARTVAAGAHTVQVRGTLRGFSPGEQWRIDDLSLVVLGAEP